MSLRDQLVAKGLASKKQARDTNRALKKDRKSRQGSKDRKAARRAEAEAAAAEAQAQAEAARVAARDADRAAREAHEHVYRVRQIIEAHRLGGRGPIPFHHRIAGRTVLGRLSLREAIVRDIRLGRAAVAGYTDDAGEPVVRIVGRKAILRLREIAPEALWHVVDEPRLDDRSEDPLRKDWEPSVRPHRVRPIEGAS